MHDVDFDCYCMVNHFDESGDVECGKCRVCKAWVRPHKINEPCPGAPDPNQPQTIKIEKLVVNHSKALVGDWTVEIIEPTRITDASLRNEKADGIP